MQRENADLERANMNLERARWQQRIECRTCAAQSLTTVLILMLLLWGIWFIGVPMGALYYCPEGHSLGAYGELSLQDLKRISNCVADCCNDDAPTHPVECMERYNCVHMCISPLLHQHENPLTEYYKETTVADANNSETQSL